MTDAQETAAPNEKWEWAGKASLVIVGVILSLMFVFPGFVAGIGERFLGLSAPGFDYNIIIAGQTGAAAAWRFGRTAFIKPKPKIRILLDPAYKLMELSPALKRFYRWEYRLVR